MPRRLRSSVTVRVCATSANMGAGFDCIGIALQLFNDLTLSSVLPDGSPVPAFAMTCVGEGSSGLPLDPSNLVARGARLAFLEAGYSSSGDGWEGLPPVAFHLVNRIPIAAGLGSSSAAIVAGLLAGLTLTGTTMSVENEERMLQLAASVEGHVDNLAACIYGGMQIGVHTGQRFFTSAVPIPPGLQCILFIPDQRQSTEGARAVLPPTVSRADAVYNIGRAALLVNAFATGALADLALATEDALHQPARAAIMPAMLPVIAAAREAGALGAFLSGAGSAILALTAGRKGDPHSQSPGERRDVRVARAMVQGARSVGMAGRVLLTHPCTGLGAHVVELDGDEGAVVAGRGLDLLEGGSSEWQAPAAGAGAAAAGSAASVHTAAAAGALAEDAAWVARARAAAVAVNPAAAAGSLRYVSTRAASPQHTPSLTFSQAVFAGTAPDGGLYVPACIPRGALTPQLLAELEGLPYSRLAARVLGVWIGEEEIPLVDLLQLTQQAYAESRWPGSGRVSGGAPEGQGAVVAPLIQLQCSSSSSASASSSSSSSTVPVHVLELFHGPTAAFKDIALQLLGCLIPYLMARAPPGSATVPKRVTVLGATSGDTGAAAVAGLQGAPGVSLVILHPAGRVAPVQAAQMTSVLAPNVHNVAVAGEGTCFDACQAAVKGAFADAAFVARHSLCAINSINWARVLAQSVYYVHAAVAWQAAQRAEGKALPPTFIVPSGNFGNALAGYYAAQLFPAPQPPLHAATNANDAVHRALAHGDYSRPPGPSQATLAPSMDITVASNFERAIYHAALQCAQAEGAPCPATAAGSAVRALQAGLGGGAGQPNMLPPALLAALQQCYSSSASGDGDIDSSIAGVLRSAGYALCPHTAAGLPAAVAAAGSGGAVLLATAHPAKFATQTPALRVEGGVGAHYAREVEGVGAGGAPGAPGLPAALVGLHSKPTRCMVVRVGGGEGAGEQLCRDVMGLCDSLVGV